MHDRPVGRVDRLAALVAAGLLDRLEEAAGGAAHRDGVGVLGWQCLGEREHPQAGGEIVRVDPEWLIHRVTIVVGRYVQARPGSGASSASTVPSISPYGRSAA